MEQKSMKDMQQQVDTYIGQFKEGYFPPMELLARLTEELGELSREVQHLYGMKKKKSTEAEKALEEELGDFLFVLICFANAEKIDMQQALDRVMTKFETRDKDRWTKKELD
ncbi:nucleotide pyrophosphohydrolase [Tetzosporium hominis]|uniref:Nucleotide pyrophosphohydrolase n=1 Tax=Tetzosporium hominis TaxID=2020506 RepID=A0A264W737_9BACL|nr:nucleotide pyrophosphohydrolase [Tetzosporium hominis]OZS79403.1 nucleotide pyrophosphohydrolase [Tetzosporium hominis]